MNQLTKRNLSKIALALAIAGYCTVPAAMADETGWIQHTETTANFNGTVPWIVRNASSDQNAAKDQGHVTVTVDRTGRANATPDDGSTEWKRLHVGDKITVSWALGDAEGDVDNNGTLNAATKTTIKWQSYSSASGDNKTAVGTVGSDSYTITADDRGRYIGLDITPTSTSGIPTTGTEISLLDLTTDSGGGDNTDDVPSGPVINDNLHVSIYKDGTMTNLLNGSTPIALDATYKVLLWSDENGNNQYDTGEEVTNNYHYRWRFTGTSKSSTPGAAGGFVAENKWDQPLVVPNTNAAAKTAFDNTDSGGVVIGADGIQGYGLSIDYKHK